MNKLLRLNFIEICKETWVIAKPKFLTFLMYFMGVFFLQTFADEYLVKQDNFVPLLLGIIIYILNPWFSLGLMKMALNIVNKKDISFSDFSFEFKFVLKYVLLSLLVGIIIVAFSILLIVPGIIAGISLSFASWIYLDKKTEIIDSLYKSKNLTEGYKIQLFILFLGMLVLNIIGAFFLGIGILITAPFSILFMAVVYRKISNAKYTKEKKVVSKLKKRTVKLVKRKSVKKTDTTKKKVVKKKK